MARSQQLESVCRVVETDEYREHKIRVVAGYDGRADAWAIHIHITKPGKPEIYRADLVDGSVPTSTQAIEHGFAAAKASIDRTLA